MANTILYGFENLADHFSDLVSVVGVQTVDDAITQSVEEHNRQLDAITELFVTKTTKAKTRYLTTATSRNQPLDQAGRARPIKPTGHYEVGLPLRDSGAAWGYNWIAGKKLTVADINRAMKQIQDGDIRWMMDNLLAAIFANATWNYNDENDDIGQLTIQPLANGDSTVYQVFGGADNGAQDTHQLFWNNAIDDSHDPFQTLYDELYEHPENGDGDYIAFIPTNLKSAVKALTGFHIIADGNVARGDQKDVLVGSLGVNVPGTVLGYHDAKVWIVEWRRLPDNYIVTVATGGDTPLAMRQDEMPELQGFVEVPDRTDHPFTERGWFRRAGFGGWNRVGAATMLVGAGAYAVPTGYTPPII